MPRCLGSAEIGGLPDYRIGGAPRVMLPLSHTPWSRVLMPRCHVPRLVLLPRFHAVAQHVRSHMRFAFVVD